MHKHPGKTLPLLVAVALLLTTPFTLKAAIGEVSLSGSTWTGKVDGVTKYTGSNMSAAGNACVGAMSSGTLRIYNSGNTGGTINLKSNVKVDAWGNTLTSDVSGGIIRARNASNTGGVNVRCAGPAWFGMYFQTSSAQTFSGISGGTGILMRIDNCAGGGGSNFYAGSPNASAGGSHAVETYGINGVTFSTVTATDRGHCGVLLNATTSANGTNVNASNCGRNTGYAAFRTANNNLGPTRIGTVNATNGCGRGFYSTTNSRDTIINTLNASGCTGIGIWLGSPSYNVIVQSGTLSNNAGGCWTDSNPASNGNRVTVTCR
jgi:hypothetical protein